MRRSRRPPGPSLGCLALAVAAAGALLAACGSTEQGAGARPTAESLAQAGRRTLATPSGRFELTVTSTAGGLLAAFSGSGSYDNVRHRVAVQIDLSGLGEAGAGSLEQRFVEGVAYVKMPAPGSEWVKYDSSSPGVGKVSPGTPLADPSGFLDYVLRVAGPVESKGRETVRGVETTHLAAASPARVDVFVDADGLVRRLRIALLAATERDGPATEVEVDYFDFGADVVIEAPAR